MLVFQDSAALTCTRQAVSGPSCHVCRKEGEEALWSTPFLGQLRGSWVEIERWSSELCVF